MMILPLCSLPLSCTVIMCTTFICPYVDNSHYTVVCTILIYFHIYFSRCVLQHMIACSLSLAFCLDCSLALSQSTRRKPVRLMNLVLDCSVFLRYVVERDRRENEREKARESEREREGCVETSPTLCLRIEDLVFVDPLLEKNRVCGLQKL